MVATQDTKPIARRVSREPIGERGERVKLDTTVRANAPRQTTRDRRRRLRLAVVAACALLAALVLAAPAPAALPTLAGSFDGSGTPDRSMQPTRIGVSETSGNVYVMDVANDVVNVFSASGTYLSQLTPDVLAARTFAFSLFEDDIAVDNSDGGNDGNVYVMSETASWSGAGVFAFDASGRLLWEAGGFADACGIAVDGSGAVWVSDFAAGIQQLDPRDGSAVGSRILTAVADGCHFDFDADGNLLVNHYNDGTVEKFQPDGRSLGVVETDPVRDVAVDRATNITYTDRQAAIGVFDASGAFQGQFGVGQFSASFGHAVNSATTQIFVTDPNDRVLIYQGTPVHTLTVTPGGAADGTVSADVGAISGCSSSGGTCADDYDEGTTITLTASPDTGAAVRWTGCTSATGNECTVILARDTTVTATFDPIPRHTLTVSKAGTGSGSVGSVPGGISCGATCDADFEEGTSVTLTAVAAANSTFTGWSGGGCSGTGTCRVTVSADTTVTATFAQDAPAVTTGAASSITQTGATVAGTVNPNGSAVSDCHVEYGTTTAYGSQVPCAAGPGSGTSAVAVSASLTGLTAGTTYHYRVVATNGGGTTNGADATFATTAATVLPPPRTCATDASLCPDPTLTLDSATARYVRGKARVKLSCTGAAGTTCTGKLTLVAKIRTGRNRRARRVVVGTVNVSIAAGTSTTVRVTIKRKGRAVLAVKGRLKVTLSGAGLDGQTLTIKRPVKK
jgi:hypothetical protein